MKRWTFFTYGVLCHLLFLATFACLAGFVTNSLVPKSIDSPPAVSPGRALLINLSLITIFALQHSIMARPGFKRVWTRLVPQPIERSTYVLIAGIVTLLLMWQWQGIEVVFWDVQQPLLRGLLWGLCAAGWLLVVAASLMIDHFDLFGTRQVWLYLRRRPYTPLPFRTPLLYRRVRHPLYVGWTLAFWVTPTMTLGHLLFAGAMTFYMAVAALIEERDLVAQFGEAYRAYQRRVPMYVPRLRPRTESPAADRNFLDASVLTDLSWWHWTLTIPLLAAHLSGAPWAIAAALALCGAITAYYLVRLRSLQAFPVQVRVAYIAWLLIGLQPGMSWMLYVSLVGLFARVLFGYCLLARMLSLAWFNRTEPLTWSLVRRVFVSAPEGGLFRGQTVPQTALPLTCSLRRGQPANATAEAFAPTLSCRMPGAQCAAER